MAKGTTPAEVARAQKMNQLLTDRDDILGKLAARSEVEKNLQFGVTTELQKQSALRRQLIQDSNKDIKMLESSHEMRLDMANKELAALEKRREKGEHISEVEEERIKFLEKIKNLTEAEATELAKILKVKQKLLKLEEKAAKQGQKTVKSWASAFGMIDASQTMLGSFLEDLKEERDIFGAMARSGKGIADAMWAAFGPMAIIATIIKNTIEWIFLQDEAISQAVQLTGATRGFASSVGDVGMSIRKYGLSAKDAAQSFGSLYEGFADFTSLSGKERAGFIRDTAIMGKLGVGADQAAKGYNTMTKTLGKSAKEARKSYKDLLMHGAALGKTPKAMAKEFASAMPKLAAWGKRAINVFKDTAKAAKAIGVETQELLGMMEGYMDFEKSANAVGTLNAVLDGPYLNSVELTMRAHKGFASQLEYIQSAFRKAEANGVSLKDNMYLMDGVAKELGWTNEQLAKAMGNDARATEENAEKKKSLEEIASQATTIMEKLAAVLGQLVGQIEWITSGLRGFADILLKITGSKGAKWFANAVFWIASVSFVLIVVVGWTMKFAGALAFVARMIGLTRAAIGLQTVASWGSVAATTAETTAKTASTAATVTDTAVKNANTLSTNAGTVSKNVSTVSTTGATVATGGYSIATGIATAATWLFNISLLSSPITWIIIGIVALIAAVIYLTGNWEKLTKWIGKTTGGFLDLWDVLLLLTGPIGWIILAGKKIIENWDVVYEFLKAGFTMFMELVSWGLYGGSIVPDFLNAANIIGDAWTAMWDWLGEKFNWFVNLVSFGLYGGSIVPEMVGASVDIGDAWYSSIDGIAKKFKSIFKDIEKMIPKWMKTMYSDMKVGWNKMIGPVKNFAASTWDSIKNWSADMGSKLGVYGADQTPEDENWFTSKERWYMPSNQYGVTDFAGGISLVGEAGPEFVTLPPHSNVITNENTSKMVSALKEGGMEKDGGLPAKTEHTLELIRALRENTISMQNDSKRDLIVKEIKLILDEREFGRAVEEYVDSKYSLAGDH